MKRKKGIVDGDRSHQIQSRRSTSVSSSATSQTQKRGPRTANACEQCKRRKTKCSGPPNPCEACSKATYLCHFNDSVESKVLPQIKPSTDDDRVQYLLAGLLNSIKYNDVEVFNTLLDSLRQDGSPQEVAERLQENFEVLQGRGIIPMDKVDGDDLLELAKKIVDTASPSVTPTGSRAHTRNNDLVLKRSASPSPQLQDYDSNARSGHPKQHDNLEDGHAGAAENARRGVARSSDSVTYSGAPQSSYALPQTQNISEQAFMTFETHLTSLPSDQDQYWPQLMYPVDGSAMLSSQPYHTLQITDGERTPIYARDDMNQYNLDYFPFAVGNESAYDFPTPRGINTVDGGAISSAAFTQMPPHNMTLTPSPWLQAPMSHQQGMADGVGAQINHRDGDGLSHNQGRSQAPPFHHQYQWQQGNHMTPDYMAWHPGTTTDILMDGDEEYLNSLQSRNAPLGRPNKSNRSNGRHG